MNMKLNIEFDRIVPNIDFGKTESYYRDVYYELVKERLPDIIDFDVYFMEVLRFLTIASQIGSTQIPVDRLADDIWHELIIQTSEYRKLCTEYLPGRCFVEHSSISTHDRLLRQGKSMNDDLKEQLSWLGYYHFYFGDFDNKVATIWSVVDFLIKECGYTLCDVNKLAFEMAQHIRHSIEEI
jgi:hypothetical protein